MSLILACLVCQVPSAATRKSKVLIGKAFRILQVTGYFHQAPLLAKLTAFLSDIKCLLGLLLVEIYENR
ncbi:MAG: hypothetical protein QNJ74_03320 [Trichodesmium sp. MO_231.B1]|nr:hypothetical protein [Trichodesmium sp. MO_231.B1]